MDMPLVFFKKMPKTPWTLKVCRINFACFFFLAFSLLNSIWDWRFASSEAESYFFWTNLSALVMFLVSSVLLFKIMLQEQASSMFSKIMFVLLVLSTIVLSYSYSDFNTSPVSPEWIKSSSSFAFELVNEVLKLKSEDA